MVEAAPQDALALVPLDKIVHSSDQAGRTGLDINLDGVVTKLAASIQGEMAKTDYTVYGSNTVVTEPSAGVPRGQALSKRGLH